MSLKSMPEDAFRPAATHGDALDSSGLLDDVRDLWLSLRELCYDQFLLAALESRRAGESLVAMLVAGVMIAVLLHGAWLGFLAAAVLGLVENGLPPSHALLLAGAFNLLLVLVLYRAIRGQSRYLQFPAILRSLQSTPSGCRDAKKP